MRTKQRLTLLWSVVALSCVLIAGALYGPMVKAWSCYWMHADGTPAVGEVVEKPGYPHMLVRLREGAYPGHSCLVKVSEHAFEETRVGQDFDVVYLPSRPERCELQATVDLSGVVLGSITAGVGFAFLLIVSLGVFLHRTLTAQGWPTRRMDVDPDRLACPVCEGKLQEGYLPLLSGIHWREMGQPVGLPHALGGLAGTTHWSGRPRLHAFRCQPCEVILFQYGMPDPGDPVPLGAPGGEQQLGAVPRQP